MHTDVMVLGGGGHAKVVLEAIETMKCVHPRVFDEDKSKVGCLLLQRFTIEDFVGWEQDLSFFHIAVGNPEVRYRLNTEAILKGLAPFTIIHSSSHISNYAVIGDGTFIGANALVAVEANIGLHCIINHSAVVDHDSEIGDFSHVAPNATLCGGVRLGQKVIIGAGATVLPGIKIGTGAVIGAGAVICTDVPSGSTVVGISAKAMRK